MRDAHIIKDTYKDKDIVIDTYDVDIIRIADYIKTVVGTRKLPSGRNGTVVMKLDVEVKGVSENFFFCCFW